MDTSVYNILANASAQYGVPMSVLYPIVMTESGGNPAAHALTPNEDSRGLFQVNTYAHTDANAQNLFDASYNANYWIPKLKPVYDAGVSQGLTGKDLTLYVERYGERPQWTSTVQDKISKYFDEFTGGGGSTDSTTKPSTTVFGLPNATGIMDTIGNWLFKSGFIITGVIILILALYLMFKE